MAEQVVVAPGASPAPTALQGLGRLAAWRQIALLGALAASVALGVTVALWSQTPNYQLLYASVGGKEAAEVLDALDNLGIPSRVDTETGAIMVPADKVHDARLKLAAQGMPKGTALGFEMLSEKPGFGTSQHREKARYQHALEVELARSVTTLNSVQDARVHLAVPRQSAFLRDGKQPSASVLLRLHPGRKLTEQQAGAIAHLVAAAVPNLEAGEVRVIDEKGRLLTASHDEEGAELGRQELRYVRALEEAHIKRVESILAPIVGLGGVKAQVTAEVDFTRIEESRERFKPDPAALRSEEVTEEEAKGVVEGGVPGALSNQPPDAASAPEIAEGAAAAGGGNAKKRRRAVRNYELDRTISHSRTPSGVVRRLSVAVVIDDHRSVDNAGTAATRSRTPEEIARITTLVKEAVGFDPERGDSVNVINAPFSQQAVPEPLPEPPFWESPLLWRLAKQAGGALLVVLLIFGVLRPVMRNLVGREVAERQQADTAEQAQLAAPDRADVAPDQISLSAGASGGVAALSAEPQHLTSVEAIRGLVNEDPKRVANVIKNWTSEDA